MTEPGYAKGRARRREIIEHATALFGEVGYRGASLREIAERCGISHTGLLHHIPNKAALLQAVLEHRDLDDVALIAASGEHGLEPLRGIVAVVAANTRRRGIVELFCVLSAEATSVDHPAHAYFVRRYERSIEEIASAYQRAAEVGALRSDIEPGIAARQLIAVMDGLQVQWLLDDRATDMEAIVRAHIEAQLTIPL